MNDKIINNLCKQTNKNGDLCKNFNEYKCINVIKSSLHVINRGDKICNSLKNL